MLKNISNFSRHICFFFKPLDYSRIQNNKLNVQHKKIKIELNSKYNKIFFQNKCTYNSIQSGILYHHQCNDNSAARNSQA